jgi:hypothetical protein
MNPNATNHPISWFKKFEADGSLDLSPKFQRRPVWSDIQASYLVDSILNDLPVPEIFVRTMTSTAGDTRLEVVDGQQRLRSIIRFYQNDLRLEGDEVTPQWTGTEWNSLNPSKQEAFWAYKLVVRELENASDPEVRDMFRRLNANMSNLNDQELRHSQLSGEFITLVEHLADDPWWLDHRIVTPSQVRRMLDVEFLAEMLVALFAGPLDKKVGLEDFFVDYDDEFPDKDKWQHLFIETRNLTEALIGGSFGRWSGKTEYYSLFVAAGWVLLDGKPPRGPKLAAAQRRLARFRTKADRAKSRGSDTPFERYVHSYADAATRAATDLSRRLTRSRILKSLIAGTRPSE